MGEASRELAKISILAVDDDLYMRELEKKLLQKRGVKDVHTADGAGAALKLLEDGSTRVDLILLDLNMPFRSGITFLKKLRGHDNTGISRIPVIIVSAEDSSGVAEQLDELDINGYVNKPINPELLLAEIIAALESPAGQ